MGVLNKCAHFRISKHNTLSISALMMGMMQSTPKNTTSARLGLVLESSFLLSNQSERNVTCVRRGNKRQKAGRLVVYLH